MSDSKPRISILFPVLNGAHFLRETLDTVTAQSYKDWELVAMDGGSTDATVEIFNEYARTHPQIKVYSGKDENGFHAIHKAAEKARGEFIYFLCASDGYLDNEWLEKCVRVMDADPQVSLVWGVPFQKREDGTFEGPNFLYAHFLPESRGFSRWAIIKKIISKLAHPVAFLKKLSPANMTAVRHILKHEEPPQKRDMFAYWLKTGMFFPDGNMCMSRRVFDECFPKYRLGSKDPGDFTAFNFNFHTKGFLAYCLPVAANFGRTHANQFGERVRAINDEYTRQYFKRLEAFRSEYTQGNILIPFISRNGMPLE